MKKLLTIALLVSLFITIFAAGAALAQEPATDPSTDTGGGTEAQQQTDVVTPTVAAEPTDAPADVVTPTVTAEPTTAPTDAPADVVTPTVTAEPTTAPTDAPADVVTPTVTAEPTVAPTDAPADVVTPTVTVEPTVEVTPEPTAEPVVVEAPVISEFTTNPDVLTAPDSSVTLSWVVSGTATVDLNGEDVTGLASKVVTVTETSAFTLTASNEGGSAVAGVAVTVIEPVALETSVGDIEVQAYAGTYNSRWAIQNMGSAPANGATKFFAVGKGGTDTPDDQISFSSLAPGAGVLYGGSDLSVSSFDGAAVVESDQPLAASVRLEVISSGTGKTNIAYASGYGSSKIGSILYIPAVYNRYYGFNSEVSIQNAAAGSVDVLLDFVDDTGSVYSYTQTIAKSGEVYRLDLESINAQLPDNNLGYTSGGWVGVLKMTSTGGDISAQAIAYNTSSGRNDLFLKDAVPSGSTFNSGTSKWEAFAPTVYRNAFPGGELGWSSAYAIADISGTSGALVCDFEYAPLAGESNQTNFTDSGRSFNFYGDFNTYATYSDANFGNAGWAGAVKVSCNKEFVGTVNLFRRISTAANQPWVATYELLTGGGTAVYCPDQFKNDNTTLANYNSTVQVMNLGNKDIKLTVEGYNSGQTSTTPAWAKTNLPTVPPGGVGGGWLSGSLFATDVPAGFFGSVKITATNADSSSDPIKMHANANVFNLTASNIGDGEGVYSCTTN